MKVRYTSDGLKWICSVLHVQEIKDDKDRKALIIMLEDDDRMDYDTLCVLGDDYARASIVDELAAGRTVDLDKVSSSVYVYAYYAEEMQIDVSVIEDVMKERDGEE